MKLSVAIKYSKSETSSQIAVSKKPNLNLTAIFTLLLAGLLSGCGQKGPLVLPSPSAASQSASFVAQPPAAR